MKRSIFCLFMALNFSLIISAPAHALDFGKIVDKAKVGITNANVISSVDIGLQKIADSRYYFSRATAVDTKWVMLNVSKGESKQQIIVPAINGRASVNIYLRYGAGIYNIAFAESKFEGKYDGGYYVGQPVRIENIDFRDLNFLLPSDLVQSDNEQIISLAKTLTMDAVNELDAVKKIHKYVASNVKYDYASYKDDSYKTKPFDAVSTLKSMTGVCAGYANLYAALLRSVGIKTKVIYGIAYLTKTQTGEHAWNEILINNEWKSVDVTWDSTTGRMFKYFDMAEEVFDQDHQKQVVQDF